MTGPKFYKGEPIEGSPLRLVLCCRPEPVSTWTANLRCSGLLYTAISLVRPLTSIDTSSAATTRHSVVCPSSLGELELRLPFLANVPPYCRSPVRIYM